MADPQKVQVFRKLAAEVREQAQAENALLEKKAELALVALKGLTTLRDKVTPR